MITSSNKILKCEVLACITATVETYPPQNLFCHFTMSNWSEILIHEILCEVSGRICSFLERVTVAGKPNHESLNHGSRPAAHLQCFIYDQIMYNSEDLN
jgi:hypothetical protein